MKGDAPTFFLNVFNFFIVVDLNVMCSVCDVMASSGHTGVDKTFSSPRPGVCALYQKIIVWFLSLKNKIYLEPQNLFTLKMKTTVYK